MFDYFRFIAWPSNWVNFISHKGLTDLIITRPGQFFLVLFFKSNRGWFKYRVGPWYLQNFNIFRFAGNNDFLSVRFEINIVGADSWILISMLAKSSQFWLHTSKGNKCFRKLGLFFLNKFIGARSGIWLFFWVSFTLTSKYEGHLY